MFEKENSSDTETQSVIKISIFLWKKYGEIMHQKVVSDQLLILVNSPKLKQRGPETSNQSLFGLQNMFRKIPSLVTYHLGNFDAFVQSWFLSYSKNYIC